MKIVMNFFAIVMMSAVLVTSFGATMKAEAATRYEEIEAHSSEPQIFLGTQTSVQHGITAAVRTVGNFSWNRPFTASVWRIDTGAWSQGRIVEVAGSRGTGTSTNVHGGWTPNLASMSRGSIAERR